MKKLLKWYYGNASIRNKLIYSYALLVSIPLLVLGIYSYRVSRQSLLVQTKDTIQNNVSIMASSLNNNIKRENDNIRYLSYNTGFREKLQGAGRDMNALVKELNNTVEPAFWYFMTSDENLKGIRIYSGSVENAVGFFCSRLPRRKRKHGMKSSACTLKRPGNIMISRSLHPG